MDAPFTKHPFQEIEAALVARAERLDSKEADLHRLQAALGRQMEILAQMATAIAELHALLREPDETPAAPGSPNLKLVPRPEPHA